MCSLVGNSVQSPTSHRFARWELGSKRKNLQDSQRTGKEATKLKAVNGWAFWKVGSETGPKLNEFRRRVLGQDTASSLGSFNNEDFAEWWTRDIGALGELVLESTGELLSTEGKLPLLQNKGQFRIARYWAFADDEPNICVEVPISSPLGRTKTPQWARYSHKTPKFELAHILLNNSLDSLVLDDQSGDLWIPIVIEENLVGSELVSDMVHQVERIDQIARGVLSIDSDGE